MFALRHCFILQLQLLCYTNILIALFRLSCNNLFNIYAKGGWGGTEVGKTKILIMEGKVRFFKDSLCEV